MSYDHRAEVAKNFRCCNHRLCFLQCDWWLENYLQTAVNVNEARGIGRMSLDPLLGWGLDMRLLLRSSYIIHAHQTVHDVVITYTCTHVLYTILLVSSLIPRLFAIHTASDIKADW